MSDLSRNKDCHLIPKKDLKDDIDNLDYYLQYGKYQAIRIWIFGSILAFVGAFSYAHLIFLLADPPDWKCKDPGVLTCNQKISGRESICEGGDVVFNTSSPNYFKSLLVENLWICNEKYHGPSVMTANYLGGMFNSLVFGFISDLYGRKLAFSISNILYIVIRLVTYQLTSNYNVFVGLIILGNSFFPFGLRVGYTLFTEICDEKGRKYNYIVGRVVWVLGLVLMPFIAKWCGDWYVFGTLSVSLNCLFIFIHPYIPESPRWLVSGRKFEEAGNLINDIRKFNNLSEIDNLEVKLATEENESKPNVKTLIGNTSLLRVFGSMALIWAVNDYFYIAGSLNAENLPGNMFTNFSLLALTELPSVFVGQFLMDRYGRRWVHCSCMVVATLPLIICIMFVTSNGEAVVGLSIISKLASNVGWFLMWVQCIEIFPTSLRSTGLTISATFASLICMTGPFVVDLGKHDLRLPFLVFSCVGALGIIFTSLVPETKGNAISGSVDDTTKLVRQFKYFQWKTWK